MLGVRFGKKVKYRDVEYLFVKMNKVSRTFTSRIQSTTISDNEFDGYIRFSEQEKIHLFSNRNRMVVLKKMTPLAQAIGVQIIDYTREQVDLS